MLYIDAFCAEMYSMHLARSLMTETGSGHPGLTCFIKEYSGPAAAPISFMGHAPYQDHVFLAYVEPHPFNNGCARIHVCFCLQAYMEPRPLIEYEF